MTGPRQPRGMKSQIMRSPKERGSKLQSPVYTRASVEAAATPATAMIARGPKNSRTAQQAPGEAAQPTETRREPLAQA
jgi:hypothetical protein